MSHYKALNTERTIQTIQRLQMRIEDRFPGSGLYQVCTELKGLAESASQKIEAISRPRIGLRLALGSFILLVLVGLIYPVSMMDFKVVKFDLAGLIQIFEAMVNDLVLIGAAIFFLFTLENRIKRKLALKSLHELRAMAHVIDMHQLTKDPMRDPGRNTANSPSRAPLSPYLLARYLGYASEMLSLTGKVAALYAKGTDDAVIMETINEVEDLTIGLSQKIWQKMLVAEQQSKAEVRK